ncbi:MAG: PilZ domain-containing protein [Syntrophobacterales bacterium]
MFSSRLKSCKLFVKQKCPYQREMERAYLIPQLLDSDQLVEYERLCLSCLKGEQQRRKSRRVPVSFFVYCQEADNTRIVGKAYNLSAEGIAIKTNYPISKNEKLGMEFIVSNRSNPLKVSGEVIWRRFHGDTCGWQETLFSAGIKYLDIEDSFRSAIEQYLLKATDQ